MAANKTQATDADVSAYLDGIADANQRADAETIIALMSKASGEPAKMWGPSIIGFGSYHYRYESGREGTSLRIGFSPRKGQIVLYLTDGHENHSGLLERLGKHKTGKSCLYVKRLADLDINVLAELVIASLAETDRRYRC
jgi:hypothetical protein